MSSTCIDLPTWLAEHHQRLLSQFESNTLSHAVFLCGEQGIGKLMLAQAVAISILCKGQAQSGVACGDCHSCKLARSMTHPDLVEVAPEEGKKIISVDQVRGLIKKVYSTPQICDEKVILIFPADRLNHNAANALLKCLEEPPANTYFLLGSAFASRLPATVRSRCRIKYIDSPSDEVAAQWLEQHGVSASDAVERLAVCRGRPIAALGQGEVLLSRHMMLRDAIAAVETGTASIGEIASTLYSIDISELLPAYMLEVLALSKAVQLGSSTAWNALALLSHLQSVQKIFISVQAGSTLNAQLAVEDMLVNLQKCRQH